MIMFNHNGKYLHMKKKLINQKGVHKEMLISITLVVTLNPN